MLIVMPVCSKDEHLAALNLKVVAKLDPGGTGCPLLIAHERGFNAVGLVEAAKPLFSSVSCFEYDPCPFGDEWPRPQNYAWQSTARHIAALPEEQRRSWLWWEQDAVPLCSGWARMLGSAYRKRGKPYAGSIVKSNGAPYLNGVAIYAWDAGNQLVSAMLSRSSPWDMMMSHHDHVLRSAADLSPILTHDFRPDGQGRVWSPGDSLPIGVALWHRCKDASLHHLVLGDAPAAQVLEVPVVENGLITFTSADMIGHTTRPAELLKHHTEAKVTGLKRQRILLIALEGTTGYGEIGKLRFHELAMAGHDVQWLPATFDDSVRDESALERFARAQQAKLGWEWDTVWAVVTPNTWDHWRRFYVREGVRFVGETIWETDSLHPEWVQRMNRGADEIIVSTQWNYDIFKRSGITKPMRVLPYQYPAEELPPRTTGMVSGLGDKTWLAYTIGQWTERKGVTETVQAFCEAFTESDDVALLVKTHWTSYRDEAKAVCRNRLDRILDAYPHHPPVLLNLESLSREEILAIHSRGDCYVSLCKAEGLGLGARDAHVFGKPVVITGWGGQVEVLGEKYPGLVKYSMIPVRGMDWIPAYLPTMNWAKPDIGHAVTLLKEAYAKHRAGVH